MIETLEQQYNDAFKRIADFIELYGLENFTVGKVKDVDSQLQNLVSKNLGGFKFIRNAVATGVLDLSKYIIKEENTDCSKEEYIDKNLIEVMTKPPVLVNENGDVIAGENESILACLGNYIKVMNDILEKVSAQGSDINEIKQSLSVVKPISTTVDRMNEKLKILENDMVDHVREKTVDMIIKYCYIKFGNNKPESIRKAYNDVYHDFDRLYNVNLDAIQVTWINVWNHNRARSGRRAIDYIDPTKEKGVRKIDIIERMGMMPELYLIVKSKLAEMLPAD